MKILAIGDPHGDLNKVKQMPLKNIDLILLNGDLGSANIMRKMFFDNINRQKQGLPKIEYSPQQKKKAFMEAYFSTINLVSYLSKLAPVYTIFGNVESSNKDTREQAKKIGLKLPFLYDALKKMHNVRVINNVVANFEGIRIGGLEYFVDAGWVREFEPPDFLKTLSEAKRESKKATSILKYFDHVDILVAHQPPYGILDQVNFKNAPKEWQGKHAGSKIISDYIKRKQPSYVFCGHIHEYAGMKKLGRTEVYNLGAAGYKIIEINPSQ